jgi:hypothetical protein
MPPEPRSDAVLKRLRSRAASLKTLSVMTTAKAAKPKLDPEALERLGHFKALVEQAQTARLSPAQEDEVAQGLKELLRGGRAGIPEAVDALPALPWNIGVSAVSELWPELKPTARKLLLGKLALQKNEATRRFRLSLARKLLTQDATTASKLAAQVCAEMRENGALSAKDRLTFSNVLVGKGRPWLLHFPAAEWKDAEAEAVAVCAIETCFVAPCAPFTQMQLLRWAAENGRLASLPNEVMVVVAKAVKRWNSRFRKQLKSEVPNLPESIAEAVAQPPGTKSEPPGESDAAAFAEEKETERFEERESTSGDFQPHSVVIPSRPAAESTRPQMPPRERSASSQSRRSTSSRSGSGGSAGESGFDLSQALRQIEAHVTGLRRELYEAKNVLRKREERSSRPRGGVEAGALRLPEAEELQRHNAQLEQTVIELRQQLEDLASHHEDQAAAMQAHGEERIESETEQFKRLLGIKLRESFAEFQSLRTQSADDVVRQHFGEMLGEVFGILEKQGVPLMDDEPAES